MIGDHVDQVDEVKKEEEKKGCETKMTEEDKETTKEGISSTVTKKNIQFILSGQQQDSSLTCERKHSDLFGLTRSPAFAAEPASTSSLSPNG